MRRLSAELQPSQAVIQRMQAMQLDLQRARQHLRRERRSDGIRSDRWGLEQPGTAPQDEDWLITYLDMVTLLMVAMIVMLAFAGPVSKQIQAMRHEDTTAEATPGIPHATPHLVAVSIPAPEESGAQPAAVPGGVFERSSQSSAPALAPLAGTFPEPATEPTVKIGSPDAKTTDRPPIVPTPETTESKPTAAAARPEAGDADAQAARADGARIAGMRSRATHIGETPAASIASARPDQPANMSAPVAPPAEATIAFPPDVKTAGPVPSEGEAVAASLPLGELGKDVEVIINKRSVSFRVNSEILFDTGQTDLSREGLAVLRRMARVLVSAGYDITVEGHTDSVRVRSSSPYPSNWELSSARAGSVVRYLQANGIPKSRLKAVGFADSRPIADNGTPEGRARNRRVELVVSKHNDE